jgi:DNA-binding NarL/FixJ family response regulator
LKIRTVCVSDQPLSTLGLRTLLNGQAEFELVGELTSDGDIVNQVKKLKPDILILDCYLLINPSEFIVRQITSAKLAVKILAINQIIDEQHFQSLIDAGVTGYLLTSEPLDVIIKSIPDVADGQFCVSESLKIFLPGQQASAPSDICDLTTREHEVLMLIAEGYTNVQIAEKLSISMGTVKNHSKSIYKKINVHTRVEAVLMGLKHGLVEIN